MLFNVDGIFVVKKSNTRKTILVIFQKNPCHGWANFLQLLVFTPREYKRSINMLLMLD